MSKPKSQKLELVPMKAVVCPLCNGKGRVESSVIKARVKCIGCEGKGWVEVHFAKVVQAPKTTSIPGIPPMPNPVQPSPHYTPYVSPNTIPGGGGGTYPIGGWGGGGAGGSNGATLTSTTTTGNTYFSGGTGGSSWKCQVCGQIVPAQMYHTCPNSASNNYAYTIKNNGIADWVDVSAKAL